MKEFDRVILLADLPADGLVRGDVGTIVHTYKDGEAFEVEFFTLSGRTIAVATVEAAELRPVSDHDISHTRELHSA
jgi:hypothetical protein